LWLPHDGGNLARDRQVMHLALFGGGGRSGPTAKRQIELFKPRLAHLTRARASQQAHPDNRGRALILGHIKRFGQLANFVL